MDESIKKVEWRTYYPFVKYFRNNDTIEITTNQWDVFDAMYEGEDSKHLAVAGWNYPNAPLINDDYFKYLIPLKHLFNIFNDYRVVTCGKQTIRLTRSNSDNNCLHPV
ncbi:hypothetical protein NQ315_014553 [Exocentrus adspersus]|uniref:Double jelly roll-like domain-containing protein n=1 Tax=Exocentrus adspersus TaxID=1586481 RepID=A0AAV8VKM9_9CUCU|nr:hypothetical protein NQ315_014553 [Exocentrus adspersus]